MASQDFIRNSNETSVFSKDKISRVEGFDFTNMVIDEDSI